MLYLLNLAEKFPQLREECLPKNFGESYWRAYIVPAWEGPGMAMTSGVAGYEYLGNHETNPELCSLCKGRKWVLHAPGRMRLELEQLITEYGWDLWINPFRVALSLPGKTLAWVKRPSNTHSLNEVLAEAITNALGVK